MWIPGAVFSWKILEKVSAGFWLQHEDFGQLGLKKQLSSKRLPSTYETFWIHRNDEKEESCYPSIAQRLRHHIFVFKKAQFGFFNDLAMLTKMARLKV